MEGIRDYWKAYLWRDAVTKLITINFLVWLAGAIAHVAGAPHLIQYLGLPESIHLLPLCPWTPLTYMFAHTDFMHMFVNMLWLLLYGQLFMQMRGGVRLCTLYVYGGLGGALAFLCLHHHSTMMGASCAVFAVIGAVTAMYPRMKVNLLIFGEVPLMILSAIAVVFFILLGTSADSRVAHTAGLAVGVAYALLSKKGIDITRPITALCSKTKPSRPHSPYGSRRNTHTASDEAELDALLDKVSRCGYASLNAAQRQRLFDLSQKIKK